ncbi:hypothetical protein FB45DRAFT_1065030 [Roridomyces roridus]|uniref:Transmembrane protein n=1 Tax=Roridomyces roridus TaxID=1738132 RepID=A0AAD7B892_9AGAR|nr:hypothetical protein FB45DRAFT_1065030 [Roridomyces roridus]
MNWPRVLDSTYAHSVVVDTQVSGSGEPLLGKPWDPQEGKSSSSRQRSILSFSLHVTLVAIQLVLLVVWHQEWEHQIVFSLDQELRVARLVKGILTTFITLYSALLVFVTQSLALGRDLHKMQLLTATHDNAAAWSGLGSAVVRLWQQRAVPASPIGVLTALTYLASISVLHTAFPGVAAPQSLVVNQSVPISTQSLPAFDFSAVDENNKEDFLYAVGQYASGSLDFLPFLTPSNTLGLHEATLYDVLEPNTGTGSVRVNATSFNISCGYIPDTAFNGKAQTINVGGTEFWLEETVNGTISTVKDILETDGTVLGGPTFPFPAVFYTTIPVLDSHNNTAPSITVINLNQPIQVFRCSLTLVHQTVLVDAQSHNLTTSESTSIRKHTSTWAPFSGQLDDLSSVVFADGARGFLDIWEGWYSAMPPTTADMALLPQLELYPFNNTVRNVAYLHDVENQLAKIVASMFWTLGHVPPPSAYTSSVFNVSLLAGQAVVTESVIQGRLNLDIISIVECLLASLALLGLSFRFLNMRRVKQDGWAMKIQSLGVLQTIWLYRNHSELAASLEQVPVPTDVNLRRAGMLRVQFINGTVRIRAADLGGINADKLSERTYGPGRPVKKSDEASPPSTWTSVTVLSLVSTVLHSTLIVIHLLLGMLCGMKLEHRITFSLAQQPLVAWLISTIATGFITIYTAGLVFLAQTLSIKRCLRTTQMLTVTHDTVTAWRGIGFALVSILHQTPSLSAVLPVFVYLLGILALHITTPALLMVQVFNSTVSVPATTQGIPTFTFSGQQLSSLEAQIDVLHSPLLYAQGALSYIPFINTSVPKLGLEGGMLYDVLENSNLGTGTATVDAVDFNMTCGYFADPVVNSTARTITILGSDYYLPSFMSGTNFSFISTLQYPWDRLPANLSADTLGTMYMSPTVFCSMIPISDSAGNTGVSVNTSGITGPGGPASGITGPSGPAKVQIFGCSLGLVNRSVSVDSQSRLLSKDQASIRKNSSTWSPFLETGNKEALASPYEALASDWESWYSVFRLSNMLPMETVEILPSLADLFFFQRFNLSAGSSVTLHQFEDALADLVASTYWTLGHIPPVPGFTPTRLEASGPPPIEVSLLKGNALFLEDTFETRLDANMYFILIGAVVSAVLLLLSLHFSAFRKTADEGIISGMGPLHIIWLYRNHPELAAELEQAVDPITLNLRKGGMGIDFEQYSLEVQRLLLDPIQAAPAHLITIPTLISLDPDAGKSRDSLYVGCSSSPRFPSMSGWMLGPRS